MSGRAYPLATVLRVARGLYDRRCDASGEPVVLALDAADESAPPTWAAWEDGSLWRFSRSLSRIEYGARVKTGPLLWLCYVYESPTWTQQPAGSFRPPLWGVTPERTPHDATGVEWSALLEVDPVDRRDGQQRFVRSADLSRLHETRAGGRPCEVCHMPIEAGSKYAERVARQNGDNRRAHPGCVVRAWVEWWQAKGGDA